MIYFLYFNCYHVLGTLVFVLQFQVFTLNRLISIHTTILQDLCDYNWHLRLDMNAVVDLWSFAWYLQSDCVYNLMSKLTNAIYVICNTFMCMTQWLMKHIYISIYKLIAVVVASIIWIQLICLIFKHLLIGNKNRMKEKKRRCGCTLA